MVAKLKKWAKKLFKKTINTTKVVVASSKSLVCLHEFDHVGQTWQPIKDQKNRHMLVEQHKCSKCDKSQYKPIEEHK